MIGPFAIFAAGVLIALAFGAGFTARRRQESRARLLEVLARAVTRDRPLPPLVTRIASELPGSIRRKADHLASRLSAGDGLADGLASADGLLPDRDVEAIRHAENGPALAPVLTELARDAGRGLTIRHRIGLAVAYPALLVPVVLFTWWRVSGVTDNFTCIPVPDLWRMDLDWVAPALPFLGFAVIGIFVLLFSPSAARLRPRRISFVGRTAAEARLYRLTAVHLETGSPLPDALRVAAAAAGRWSVRRRAENAAERLERGESVQTVWSWLPHAGASLATRLRRMADLRSARQRTKTNRRLALVHPLTVLVFAAIAFFQFRLLVELFALQRGAILPW